MDARRGGGRKAAVPGGHVAVARGFGVECLGLSVYRGPCNTRFRPPSASFSRARSSGDREE
eukprot:352953-Chlamydomonas_euryale.AAC.5